MKKTFIILSLFCLCLFISGCSKKPAGEIGEKAKETGEKVFQKLRGTAHQDNLMYLKNKINTYKRQNGRYPDSLQQLVNEGFIDRIPEPPAGMQYQYDPSTGKLSFKQ